MLISMPAKLAVAWSTMFLIGTELFVLSPLLPVLAADYRVSPTMAGLSVTAFSLTYMIAAPLLGQIADRIGRRRVLTFSLCAFAAANLLTAGAANLSSLIAVRLLAGTAAAGVSPSIYALVGSAAPPHRRATWLALAVSGLVMSLALGASAGGWIGAAFGWSRVFIGLAGFGLTLALLNHCVWRCEPAVSGGGSPEVLPPLASQLARRLIPTIMWSTGLYGVYTYLGAGLAADGLSSGQTAKAVLTYGCGAIIGVVLGGRAADRLGAKLTAGVSLAGLCLCLILLRWALDMGRLVEPALGISSAVAQLFFPAQQAGLANDFPHQRGTVLAWNNSALFCGISLGSLLGGEAFALASFDANLVVCAGIALLGCIINALLVPGRSPLAAAGGAPRR